MRIEAKKAVRNVRVQVCDESGNRLNFLFVHIARDQERACQEKRWRGPFSRPFGEDVEVVKSFLIGDPAKGIMNSLIPSFQVNLDASACFG